MNKRILLTGGAGYIGSHLYVLLFNLGYKPVILDNFSTSHRNVIKNIKKITKSDVLIQEGNLCNNKFVTKVIKDFEIESVIHLAAFKSVEDSIMYPKEYSDNNLGGTRSLLDAMEECKCDNLIFSSSATIYGNKSESPVSEDSKRISLNPYAETKIMSEDMILDFSERNKEFKYGILRYFNPAGAHDTGIIGEHYNEKSTNLFPIISKIIKTSEGKLNIYGSDYETHDGTPIRDFIHIMDLVEGHIRSLKYLMEKKQNLIINLGTGKGNTVLDIIKTYSRCLKKEINFDFCNRRLGDVSISIADSELSHKLLKWKAKRSIVDICNSNIKWNELYPDGYNF